MSISYSNTPARGRLATALLLPILLAFACAKPPVIHEDPYPEGEGALVSVLFSASGPTKATLIDPAGETAVGRWAVFAFDTADGWFTYETSVSGDPISMTLRAGRSYSCWAIVNYPVTGTGAFDPSTVRSPEDLSGKVACLSDNAVGRLLMFGSVEFTPQATYYDPEDPSTAASETRTIAVTRLVSRIDLDGIAVDFSGKPALQAKTFTLRGVYVTNAYRTTRYGSDYGGQELSGSRAAWYNSGGWHRGEAADEALDALLGDRGINAVVSAGSPYGTAHSFYVFPNATAKGDDDRETAAWSVRCTRLVIEATLGGETLYYSIPVPSMVRNRIYSAATVTIRGRGSTDPEAESTDLDVNITDTDWNDGWDNPDDPEIDL